MRSSNDAEVQVVAHFLGFCVNPHERLDEIRRDWNIDDDGARMDIADNDIDWLIERVERLDGEVERLTVELTHRVGWEERCLRAGFDDCLREVELRVQRLRDWQAHVLPNDEARAQVQAYDAVLDIIKKARDGNERS